MIILLKEYRTNSESKAFWREQKKVDPIISNFEAINDDKSSVQKGLSMNPKTKVHSS